MVHDPAGLQAVLLLIGVMGLDFPFPYPPAPACLSHPHTRMSPWGMLPWGRAQLSLLCPCSSMSELPHSSGMQRVYGPPHQPWDVRQAVEQKLRWAKEMSQAQKANYEPSMLLTDASLRPHQGQKILAGTHMLVRSRVTPLLRLLAHGPKPNIVSQTQDMKTGGKDSRNQQNAHCWGLYFHSPIIFPFMGNLYSCLRDLNNGLSLQWMKLLFCDV